MKAAALLIIGCSVIAAQSNSAKVTAEKEVLDVEMKYNGAYAANDLAAYFGFLAPDFTQWLPGGRTDKDSYVKSWSRFIQNGGKVLSADFTDMVIQVSPEADSAVASYLLHVVTHSARGDSDEYFQESDFLFKHNGEWKLAHLNYAPAKKKTKQ